MFWRKKKPTGPPFVGCFGKLPVTGDFIRHNAGGEEVAAFDHWLGGALDHCQRALGPQFEEAYPASVGLFIFRGDTKADDELPSRALVGAWAASRDSAGRSYPMIVFASCDYGQLAALGPAIPIALWPVLTVAYECATQGRAWSTEQFLSKVQRIEVPSLDDPQQAGARYRRWLTENTMQAFWDTGFGSDASRYWVASSLWEAMEPFRGKEVPQSSLAVRLPIGPGDAYSTAVWLDLILRFSGLKQTVVNTFWIPRKTALFHLGPPHTASFRELIAPTGTAEHVAELCGVPEVPDEACRRKLLPQHEAAVALTDQPISSFLQAIV